MCILFVHCDPDPPRGGYRLIIASNRDEYYTRRAQGVAICESSGVIGGRDMHPGREGGMWLGVTTKPNGTSKARFAALLNVTGEERKGDVEGRGFIVADYLSSQHDLVEYIKILEANGPHNAFNMVAVELGGGGGAKVYHHSNLQEALIIYEGKQTLGFGNSNPRAPFTKVKRGVERFESLVAGVCEKDRLIDELLSLLKWEERHLPDAELERRAPGAYEQLSSVFVKIEQAGYGTRTHSIVLVDEQWNVDFVESTMEEPIDISKPTWIHKHIVSRL